MSRPEIHDVHVRMAAERLGRAERAKVAIVFRSGSPAFEVQVEGGSSIRYFDLPGWPQLDVDCHVRTGTLAGKPVHILCGCGRFHDAGRIDAMAVAIETLERCGVEIIVIVDEVRSLAEHVPPGSVMIVRDHFSLSGQDPLVGEESPERFVDMRNAYDPALQDLTGVIVADSGEPIAEGLYCWHPGPSRPTNAQDRAFQSLGAHAVGMGIVPEAILARRHGMRVAALCAVVDTCAGHPGATSESVAELARLSSDRVSVFLRGIVEAVG